MIDKSIQSLTRTAPPGASVASSLRRVIRNVSSARHTRTSIIRLPSGRDPGEIDTFPTGTC